MRLASRTITAHCCRCWVYRIEANRTLELIFTFGLSLIIINRWCRRDCRNRRWWDGWFCKLRVMCNGKRIITAGGAMCYWNGHVGLQMEWGIINSFLSLNFLMTFITFVHITTSNFFNRFTTYCNNNNNNVTLRTNTYISKFAVFLSPYAIPKKMIRKKIEM
jgi:hypothetical protein